MLHTDLNNENVIVDEQALLVDWGWATRGAPWLDAGYWVIWLVAAGEHPPENAEQWAARIPSWVTAPRHGINAFAHANANMWEEIAGPEPDPWTQRTLDAARRWASHRAA
ncbi:phosphotransferase [Streptomyces albireticuli]|uniref:phosphotransferase n=1 Tax=Streptomyces albireticuli TaxID=1940 RepID=UPI002279D81F|nr:phosphotransferase [Streptomyces albireticuli]